MVILNSYRYSLDILWVSILKHCQIILLHIRFSMFTLEWFKSKFKSCWNLFSKQSRGNSNNLPFERVKQFLSFNVQFVSTTNIFWQRIKIFYCSKNFGLNLREQSSSVRRRHIICIPSIYPENMRQKEQSLGF